MGSLCKNLTASQRLKLSKEQGRMTEDRERPDFDGTGGREIQGNLHETWQEKLWKGWKQEPLLPLIPIGMGATVYYMTRMVATKSKSGALQQRMMRGRVLSQAFTVIAMRLSGMWAGYRQKENGVTAQRQQAKA